MWLVLSWKARPGVFPRRLQKFLEEELAREATLRVIRAEAGHEFHEAVWAVSLTIVRPDRLNCYIMRDSTGGSW